MNLKTAVIASYVSWQTAVVSAGDGVLNAPTLVRGPRYNATPATTKVGKKASNFSFSDNVGKKSPMASSSLDTDTDAVPTLKRFTKDHTVTLHGVNHDVPLIVEEVIFLEEALLDAMNEVHKDDDIVTRSAILTKEELDEEYYASPGENHNEDTFLRGTVGQRDLFNENIDNGSFFDVHILLDTTCYLCNDDINSDPRVIRTRAPTRAPTKVPIKVPTKPPTKAPTRPPTRRRGLRSGGKSTALETAFCTTVRTSSFPRFTSTTGCTIE